MPRSAKGPAQDAQRAYTAARRRRHFLGNGWCIPATGPRRDTTGEPRGAARRPVGRCLSFDLARAYDAAGKADSAAMMFERYLAIPFAFKADVDLDPMRVPAIRERLGQLYEGMGDTTKAIANYHAFIELWKNADPELQPRVADARRRLARLTQPEQPRR